jgi:hypothetical protein
MVHGPAKIAANCGRLDIRQLSRFCHVSVTIASTINTSSHSSSSTGQQADHQTVRLM